MSLLYAVVFASKCTSNHHRLALDALRQLECENAERWRMLLLRHHQAYLDGAKAPDVTFKDFKNHVLHVREGEWGGAIEAAGAWYERTVSALQAQDFKQAAYAAGVMSHYVVDPFQPFHTHQSETETVIHAAVERSFSKSFKELHAILEGEQGYPVVEVSRDPDWLAAAIRAGAQKANRFYELVIDHYDFDAGTKNPAAGLDQEVKDAIAAQMGLASVTLARILDRAFKQAGVIPPEVDSSLDVVFAALQGPIGWITNKLEDAEMARLVKAQYEEFQLRGKVLETLTEDEKTMRRLHCEEVRREPVSTIDAEWPRQTGTQHGWGAPPRPTPKIKTVPRFGMPRLPRAAEPLPGRGTFNTRPLTPPPRLPTFEEEGIIAPAPARPAGVTAPKSPAPAPTPAPTPAPAPAPAPAPMPTASAPAPAAEAPAPTPASTPTRARLAGPDPIVDAPSIGPKTAARLEAIGVRTVDEFLAMAPAAIADMLDARHITAETVAEWQDQARLACAVPGLSSKVAQTLTACGVRELQALAQAELEALTTSAAAFAQSKDGERLWNGKSPTPQDVQAWIDAARAA